MFLEMLKFSQKDGRSYRFFLKEDKTQRCQRKIKISSKRGVRRQLRGSSHKQRLAPSGGDTRLMATSEGLHLQQPVRGQGHRAPERDTQRGGW